MPPRAPRRVRKALVAVQRGSFGYLLTVLRARYPPLTNMVEKSNESLWDGQPVNLARHIVNLKETYTEHVPPPPVVAYISRDWRDHGARQDLRPQPPSRAHAHKQKLHLLADS